MVLSGAAAVRLGGGQVPCMQIAARSKHARTGILFTRPPGLCTLSCIQCAALLSAFTRHHHLIVLLTCAPLLLQ
jgi:hypothetical protein